MLAVKYSAFAIIATFLNIAFQYLSLLIYSDYGALYIAMAIGTGIGLISKYILDKKYIFYHIPKDMNDDLKKFVIYIAMGVFTTAIYVSLEIGFDLYFDDEHAKFIGAIIGLSIGYVIKYFLDKKYVFIHGADK